MIEGSSNIGNGLEFNGVDNYVEVPFYTSGNQITVEVIFKKINSGVGFSSLYFIGNQNITNQEYFFLAINETTGRVILYSASDSGNVEFIESPVIPLNKIISVVASVDYSAKTMSLYVNGNLIGSNILGVGTYTIALTPSSIGRASYNTPQNPIYYLRGQIYRASVYDKQLSASEVNYLYNGITPKELGLDGNLFLDLDFNQKSGNKVWDRSGNNNHGILTNYSSTSYGTPNVWVDEKGNTAK